MARCSCVVFFDVESTGLHIGTAEVIELASVARILLPTGWAEASGRRPFRVLVRPFRKISRKIAGLTGLSPEQVEQNGLSFHDALKAWYIWLREELRAARDAAGPDVSMWLAGHNVLAYDVPLLVAQDHRQRLAQLELSGGFCFQPSIFEGLADIRGIIDTLRLCRGLARVSSFCPRSFKLSNLYHYVLQQPMQQAHSALGDVAALEELCASPQLLDALLEALHSSSPAVVPARQALSHAEQLARRAEGRTLGVKRAEKPKGSRGGAREGKPLPRWRFGVLKINEA